MNRRDSRFSRKRRQRSQRQRELGEQPRSGLVPSAVKTLPVDPLKDAVTLESLQHLTMAAYQDHLGSAISRRGRGKGAAQALPGLLEVRQTLKWAAWRGRRARKVLREVELDLPKGGKAWRLAVTLENAKWVVSEDKLTKAFVTDVRKQVQRAAKRIKSIFMLAGTLDVAPVRDAEIGLRAWSLHSHMAVYVVAPSLEAAKVLIHEAFPYKKEAAKGVLKPVYVTEIYDAKGWDDYQNKVYHLDRVTQRIVRRDAVGRRLETDKRPLTRAQRATLAGFYARLTPDSLMIWIGHRRYGRRLLPM